MQEVQQSKEKTLANNRTLAEQNLALQPTLEHKKEQLINRYRCLQESFESYQLRKSTLGAVAEMNLTIDHTLDNTMQIIYFYCRCYRSKKSMLFGYYYII